MALNALLAVGNLHEARRRTAEGMVIADETGQPGLRSLAHFYYAAAVDALGDHEEAEHLAQVGAELGQQGGFSDAVMFYGAHMWIHWTFEGQPDIGAHMAAPAVAEYPTLVAWQGAVALDLALTGQNKELEGILDPAVLGRAPVDLFWLAAQYGFATAQGFGVENPALAATICEALAPYRSLHASYGIGYMGPIEVALAVAARVAGDHDAALAHHEAAATTIEACGAARARALNGYQWALTLLVGNAPSDRQRAIAMAEETLAYCEHKGYATFITKTEELLAQLR